MAALRPLDFDGDSAYDQGRMAKQRKTADEGEQRAVTAERAARLYQLLHILAGAPQSRETLKKKLRLDVRGFYRDLELLRSAGITLPMQSGRYILEQNLDQAIALLPFPDPHLTLGEASELAKGRKAAHQKLKTQLTRITSHVPARRAGRGQKSGRK
jgi:predicted DNA-binding transcriptional regulator YafY